MDGYKRVIEVGLVGTSISRVHIWSSMEQFVEGWTIVQTLGEGAYGKVKLLVNETSGEAVAMKIVNLEKHPEAASSIRKEICILTMLKDPHIIKYYGQRREGNVEYIFLEYAAGGELFDRIEPDVGMPAWEAQKYFRQLLSGVEYLHSMGVAHRDLKPENLLLDAHDDLKITDFGMATLYRHQGRERPLEKRCGTLPYVAPEVLIRPYHAEPADVWSCGIILVAMLTGELPWDKPTSDCPEYVHWKDGKFTNTPWTKLDNLALSLARKILVPLPSSRFTIQKVKNHLWFKKRYLKSQVIRPADTPPAAKRMCSGSDLSPPSLNDDSGTRLCLTQPEPIMRSGPPECYPEENVMFSFSQPAHIDDLLLSTQMNGTQTTPSQNNLFQKLVRRMTRFFVVTDREMTMKELQVLLEKMKYSWKVNPAGVMTITTVDRRKMQLIFKANLIDMDGKILLDFRLSKGCGLEFKRQFKRLREGLSKILVKGPVTWPIAIATNCVP